MMVPTDERRIPTAAVPDPIPERQARKARFEHNRPLVPLELEITGFAAGARGLAHAPDGRVTFVDFALPGERVIAEITSERQDYITASAVLVLEPSSRRVQPRCQYFGLCGGCQLQHADYPHQLELKTAIVREQLTRVGRFDADEANRLVRPMLGMDDPWGYRNHMRFTVRRDGQVGFMRRGTHRFLHIEDCPIAAPRANEILHQVQGQTTGTRQIAIRLGRHTGSELIQPRLKWRPRARGSRPRSGQSRYTESLNGFEYQVSAPSFFQVNSLQAEAIVTMVLDRVTAATPAVVVDAYAGVGTFAAQLADVVPTVVTIEESAAAGVDADVNLAHADNVERVVARVEDALPDMTPSPDVVVIDPPRAGLAAVVTQAILASAARRLVYVSCDPGTLARDLRLLVDGGFAIAEVQPVDMFPHTQHIECVTTLDRGEPAP